MLGTGSCMMYDAMKDPADSGQFTISGSVLDKENSCPLENIQVKLTTYSGDSNIIREQCSCTSNIKGEYVLVSEKWTKGDFYRITVEDPSGLYVYAGEAGLTVERNDPSIKILTNQNIFMIKSGR